MGIDILNHLRSTKWDNPKEILSYLDDNLNKLGQGFFSVVYEIIIDGRHDVIKVNSGDYDHGYLRFAKYSMEYPNKHLPSIYELNEDNSFYWVHSEMLSNLKGYNKRTDPNEIKYLRSELRRMADKKPIDICHQFTNDINSQINEILDSMKNFDFESCSVDVNLYNLMERDSTWVMIDPITIIKKV